MELQDLKEIFITAESGSQIVGVVIKQYYW